MRRTERCNPPDGATFPDSIMSNIPRQGTATLAVLIDADNAAPAIVEGLLAEVAKYGVAAVKRIYGDWTKPNLAGWKEKLLSHSIQPIQQFRYTVGKNATDSAMIIDAMDLLYTGRFHGFCIVSSDSDFTRLASRIRQQGLIVYGFGERKTPKPFVTACDKFIYSDVLRAEVEAEGAAAPTRRRSTGELRQDARLVRLLQNASQAVSDDDGWATLGGIGNHIAKQAPEFDSRNYGYGKLSELVLATELFEVETRNGGNNKTIWVRLKKRGKRPAPGAQMAELPERSETAGLAEASEPRDMRDRREIAEPAPVAPEQQDAADDTEQVDAEVGAEVGAEVDAEVNEGGYEGGRNDVLDEGAMGATASTLIAETVDEVPADTNGKGKSRGKRARRPEVTLGDNPWPIEASVFAAPGTTVLSAQPQATPPAPEPTLAPTPVPATAPAAEQPAGKAGAPKTAASPAASKPAAKKRAAPRKRAASKTAG